MLNKITNVEVEKTRKYINLLYELGIVIYYAETWDRAVIEHHGKYVCNLEIPSTEWGHTFCFWH